MLVGAAYGWKLPSAAWPGWCSPPQALAQGVGEFVSGQAFDNPVVVGHRSAINFTM
jgi:hypothetical protein